MEQKVCLNCGDVFPYKYNKKYCTNMCGEEYRLKIKPLYDVHKKRACEVCGVERPKGRRWCEKRLHIHHIDNDPSNNNPSNLKTLCRNCHISEHKRSTNQSFHPV